VVILLDIDDTIAQVLANCDISDARHAGNYSICGLALRLRDLYKWEHGLPPWEEADSAMMLDWIDARERRWESLAESDYRPIRLAGQTFEFMDISGINARLQAEGLFYSAGHAHGLKPSFVLAGIERRERVRGYPVCILGRELARDLLTLPAFRQDDTVVLRQQSGRMYLWDRMAYIDRSGRSALEFALRRAGVRPDGLRFRRQHFDRLFAVASRIFVDHEIGEIREAVFPRETWRRIVGAFPHTPVELSVRALKDLLADTGPQGTLRRIVEDRDAAALGFFIAFLDGMRKEFFPELRRVFPEFVRQEDWRIVEDAVVAGFDNAKRKALRIIDIFEEGRRRDDPAKTAEKIEKEILGTIPSLARD